VRSEGNHNQVRFDDRLQTVLNQPAEDRHDAAVRWRQLVDLVARAGANSVSPVVADALDAIRGEAARVEEPLRAAAARAVAAFPLPLGLLEYFASDSLAVSAPVLAAATLDPRQWQSVHAAADEETKRFIETLHPEVTAEPHVESAAGGEEDFGAPSDVAQPEPYAPPSLHEVVERIERRRRLRAEQVSPSALSVTQEAPALFRWECGPGGDIAWVEGAPRGALIGRSIAKSLDGNRVDQEVVRSFAMRAPFRDASMNVAGEGILAGEWKISGVPAFEPADGRFAGYRGVALREERPPIAAPEPDSMPDVLTDPDSLRELVHEIKTPLNAIIGFAEIIEGQYLGPADRGYRDRATEIVRQARLLLAAIDDLDFAAKVHSAGTARERVDLGALLERAADELRGIASRRGAQVEVIRPHGEVTAGVEPELADRLLVRLFTTLADHAERGERFQVSSELGREGARIVIGRPAALRGLSDAEIFDPAPGAARVRGGFSMRLARGLARIAGGDLTGGRDAFTLQFPRR
jgi:hypothetical protein